MLKSKTRKIVWLSGLSILMVTFIILMSTLAFGKSISLDGVGPLLPVFVILGGTLVLLQLVPALLLLFTFIATIVRATASHGTVLSIFRKVGNGYEDVDQSKDDPFLPKKVEV